MREQKEKMKTGETFETFMRRLIESSPSSKIREEGLKLLEKSKKEGFKGIEAGKYYEHILDDELSTVFFKNHPLVTFDKDDIVRYEPFDPDKENRPKGFDVLEIVWCPIWIRSLFPLLSEANLTSNDNFYDLGAGDFRANFLASHYFNVKKSVGVEYSLSLTNIAKKLKDSLIKNDINVRNVKIINSNIFDVPLEDATVIYTFTSQFEQKNKEKLVSKVKEETKKGTRFISTYRVPSLDVLTAIPGRYAGVGEEGIMYIHEI